MRDLVDRYVREVEKYFLSLAGKGIMLSSKDYDLIAGWKKRGVPAEVVFRGISNAAEALKKKKGVCAFPLNVAGLAYFIEQEIALYRRTEKDKSPNTELKRDDLIAKITERLAVAIKSEKRGDIKAHYVRVRKRVVEITDSAKENIFGELDRVEEDFFEIFFRALPEPEQERIKLGAESMIAKRRRFMTDKARRESFLSFRNEILKKDYGLINIISVDD